MAGESSRLTSDLRWRGAAVAFLIDIPLLFVTNHLVPPPLFWRLMGCLLAVLAAPGRWTVTCVGGRHG